MILILALLFVGLMIMIIINYDIISEVLEDEDRINLVDDIYNDLCKKTYYSDMEFFDDLEDELSKNGFSEDEIDEIKDGFEVRI